jgi:hypothetical protein
MNSNMGIRALAEAATVPARRRGLATALAGRRVQREGPCACSRVAGRGSRPPALTARTRAAGACVARAAPGGLGAGRHAGRHAAAAARGAALHSRLRSAAPPAAAAPDLRRRARPCLSPQRRCEAVRASKWVWSGSLRQGRRGAYARDTCSDEKQAVRFLLKEDGGRGWNTDEESTLDLFGRVDANCFGIFGPDNKVCMGRGS